MTAATWHTPKEKLPADGERVLCIYLGVYSPRVVAFWIDAGGMHHFGDQPITHWTELPPLPAVPDGDEWKYE